MGVLSVLFTERAIKELTKLDTPVKKMILSWIEKNIKGTTDPRLYGKALTGDKKNYWRYRVGNYRIIAEIRDTELVIIALSIANRSSVYTNFWHTTPFEEDSVKEAMKKTRFNDLEIKQVIDIKKMSCSPTKVNNSFNS